MKLTATQRLAITTIADLGGGTVHWWPGGYWIPGLSRLGPDDVNVAPAGEVAVDGLVYSLPEPRLPKGAMFAGQRVAYHGVPPLAGDWFSSTTINCLARLRLLQESGSFDCYSLTDAGRTEAERLRSHAEVVVRRRPDGTTGPVIHTLKVWAQFFPDIASGAKTFELRRDDRDYQVGDLLDLKAWNPETEKYTGLGIMLFVTYVLRDAPHFGLMPGFCILSLGDDPRNIRKHWTAP